MKAEVGSAVETYTRGYDAAPPVLSKGENSNPNRSSVLNLEGHQQKISGWERRLVEDREMTKAAAVILVNMHESAVGNKRPITRNEFETFEETLEDLGIDRDGVPRMLPSVTAALNALKALNKNTRDEGREVAASTVAQFEIAQRNAQIMREALFRLFDTTSAEVTSGSPVDRDTLLQCFRPV